MWWLQTSWWFLVHGHTSIALYWWLGDPVLAILLTYVWESVEHILRVSFPGLRFNEAPGDSLLGDPLVNASHIGWAHLLHQVLPPIPGSAWARFGLFVGHVLAAGGLWFEAAGGQYWFVAARSVLLIGYAVVFASIDQVAVLGAVLGLFLVQALTLTSLPRSPTLNVVMGWVVAASLLVGVAVITTAAHGH